MTESTSRPRMEGARERAVLRGTLDLLAEVGYDRLTLDAVAARTRASKATLYRRWASKAALVTEAVALLGPAELPLPDTGSLRADLLAIAGMEGYFDADGAKLVGGLATAVYRDPEVHEADPPEGGRHRHDPPARPVAAGRGARAAPPGCRHRPDQQSRAGDGVLPARVRDAGKIDPDFVHRLIEHVIVPAVTPSEDPA